MVPPPHRAGAGLSACRAAVRPVAGDHFRGGADRRVDNRGEVGHGPHLVAIFDPALPGQRCGGFGGLLGRSDCAAAVAVAALRRLRRRDAVRGALRDSVLPGGAAERVPEALGSFPGLGSAHPGLCRGALPADGRGYSVPPRLCLHAGHAVRVRGFLRHPVLGCGSGPEKTSKTWATAA